MGARANGLAYASACVSDVWSLTNNIAGLAGTDHVTAGFSYHALPSFRFYNRMAAVFGVPMKAGAAGASLFRFGDDLYNEHILSLGFANTFGLASLGLKANYIQYRAAGMESRRAFTLSFGGIATLGPHLFFGAHIVNINQPVINELTGEKIPAQLVAGLAFKPSDKFFLATEIEKDLAYSATLKAGIEYHVVKSIAFRTGLNLNPEAGYFGVGFKGRKLHLDYALQFTHPTLLSHQATVSCLFGKS